MSASRAWTVLVVALLQTDLGAQSVLDSDQKTEEFLQRSWFREHGLPDDHVQGILQTSDGYLWIATARGLARFDGLHFTVFDRVNTDAFHSDDCRSLVEDKDRNIWVGTRDGVIRIGAGQFVRIIEQDFNQQDCLPVLHAGASGNVWVGGSGFLSELNKASPGTNILASTYPDPRQKPWVFGIQEDRSGKLLLATSSGLMRFDPKTRSLDQISTQTQFDRLPAKAMSQGSSNKQWVLFSEYPEEDFHIKGGFKLLACFQDDRLMESRQFSPAKFISDPQAGLFILEDSSGVVWLPSGANTIFRFANAKLDQLPLAHKLETERVHTACEDREGNLWFGTIFSGLQEWQRRKIRAYSTADGLVNDNVWSIYEKRDGTVLIATDGGVAQFKDGHFKALVPHESPTLEYARSIAEDRDGTIWIGKMRKIQKVKNGTIEQVVLPGGEWENKTRVLLASDDGAIWIGTVFGLTRLKGVERRKYTKANGLGSDEVCALLEDHKTHDLWVGTSKGGLSRLHEDSIKTFTTAEGLSNNNVWALYQDREKNLWIGSERGLNCLQDGHITTFTTADGLPNDEVNSILEDDFGRLWISHDHGIYWVHKRELIELTRTRSKQIRAVAYDESDGLLSLETNGQKSNPAACKTRDGLLWFSTTKGVAVFDPRKVALDEVPPLTVIERVRANGQGLFDNSLSKPVIRHGDHSSLKNRVDERDPVGNGPSKVWQVSPGTARILEFRYTANTFLAPEKVRFKYRLIGLDDHWIDAGNRREALFNDLRPGDYQFEVIACNHHGVWPASGTILKFHLLPFYYQTWWFYSVSAILTAALIAVIFIWRVREARRIHRLERVNALNEQRKQIARDIHDELGASLTHIIQMSGPTRENLTASAYNEKQASRIRITAERAVDNISEILWVTNPAYDTLEDLITYLREYAATFFELSPIEVKFHFPESVAELVVSGSFRRNLLMLFKEALQNVMKHAAATQVLITLTIEDGILRLFITDNGKGLPGNFSENTGNGIANMRERVCGLGGQFELVSLVSSGAEVRVSLPIETQRR